MKSFEEIRNSKEFQSKERHPIGGSGWVTVRGKILFVIYSTNDGWDHVSVSTPSRCPTWEEMVAVKNVFFSEEECCVQFHPKKSEYVNIMPFCLHIWKPQNQVIPCPPKRLVM